MYHMFVEKWTENIQKMGMDGYKAWQKEGTEAEIEMGYLRGKPSVTQFI